MNINQPTTTQWGQLGCSGFIILDKNLNVICEKSKAFMEVRDRAFDDVEDILKGILAKGKRGRSTEEDKERVKKAEKHACYRDDWKPDEKEEVKIKVKNVKSVGNDEIDAQHRACEKCLSTLAKTPNGRCLEKLKEELDNHFSYEEKILCSITDSKDEKDDGSFNAASSKLTSHIADHKRILSEVNKALNKLRESLSSYSVKSLKQQIDFAGSHYRDCITKSDLKDRAFETLKVEDSVVNTCLSWWNDHERYDQSYRMDLKVVCSNTCTSKNNKK